MLREAFRTVYVLLHSSVFNGLQYLSKSGVKKEDSAGVGSA